MQKPNIEAEVHNSNKNVTEGKKEKKKKLKSLIGFQSANKIDNFNWDEGEEKKNQKNLTNKSKHRNDKFFLESLLSESFPRWESESTLSP